MKERCGDIPLHVTENGGAFYDPPMARGGRVEDPLRVECYREHLRAVRDAIVRGVDVRGVDVRGYFTWSPLENLEWSAGFTHRFGLVHVDFETQVRTLKTSADFYRTIIRTHGAHLDV